MIPYFSTAELSKLPIYSVPNAYVPGVTPTATTIEDMDKDGLLCGQHLDLGRALGLMKITIHLKYQYSYSYARLYKNDSDEYSIGASPVIGGIYDYPQPWSWPDHVAGGGNGPANLGTKIEPPPDPAPPGPVTNEQTFVFNKDQFTLVNLSFKSLVANPSGTRDLSQQRCEMISGLVAPRPVLFFCRPGAGPSTASKGLFTLYPLWQKDSGGSYSDPFHPTPANYTPGPQKDQRIWALGGRLWVKITDASQTIPTNTAVDNQSFGFTPRSSKINEWVFNLPTLNNRVDLRRGIYANSPAFGWAGGVTLLNKDKILTHDDVPKVTTSWIRYQDSDNLELDTTSPNYGKWSGGPSRLSRYVYYLQVYRELHAQADFSYTP